MVSLLRTPNRELCPCKGFLIGSCKTRIIPVRSIITKTDILASGLHHLNFLRQLINGAPSTSVETIISNQDKFCTEYQQKTDIIQLKVSTCNTDLGCFGFGSVCPPSLIYWYPIHLYGHQVHNDQCRSSELKSLKCLNTGKAIQNFSDMDMGNHPDCSQLP